MITVTNLCLKYVKEFYALYKINLEINEGEKVCLVGQNESGKTSLLRVMAGLEIPTSGEIFINNKLLQSVDFSQDLEVGYVPNKPFLLENKTVEQNLMYIFSFRNIDKTYAWNKIMEQAKNFELSSDLKRKAKHLSPYKRMLLQLARVSLRDVKLFLIDNIFDKFSETETENLKKHLKTLLSSHDVAAVICATDENIASCFDAKIIKMEKGSIVS